MADRSKSKAGDRSSKSGDRSLKASDLAAKLRVDPGSRVKLSKVDAGETHGFDKDSAENAGARDLERLATFQEQVWAEHRHRILIVLQGIDASGKDGTIKHVMTTFNPQGCRVVGFGVPTEPELAHDYLWRIEAQTPRTGEIAIFNRSHYESVLVERVHDLVPKSRWSKRYDHINAWERRLTDEGTTIIKLFLHISPEEQLERFHARYVDPTKRWKVNVKDLDERKLWRDYQAAFEDALSRCSTEAAPWYVIPADRKWFRNLAAGAIVASVLDGLHLSYPVRDDSPAELILPESTA
jgi:PPK2 family polyphosphate:nucleotide phosphotransferase